MARPKDMTEKEFKAALARRGMHIVGFMGYVDVGRGLAVSRWNAGKNRRAQLAYLIRSLENYEKELGIDID